MKWRPSLLSCSQRCCTSLILGRLVCKEWWRVALWRGWCLRWVLRHAVGWNRAWVEDHGEEWNWCCNNGLFVALHLVRSQSAYKGITKCSFHHPWHTHTLSLTHSLSHAHTHTHGDTHTQSLSLSLSFSLSLSLTRTHTTNTCTTGDGLVQWEGNNRSVRRREETGFSVLT